MPKYEADMVHMKMKAVAVALRGASDRKLASLENQERDLGHLLSSMECQNAVS